MSAPLKVNVFVPSTHVQPVPLEDRSNEFDSSDRGVVSLNAASPSFEPIASAANTPIVIIETIMHSTSNDAKALVESFFINFPHFLEYFLRILPDERQAVVSRPKGSGFPLAHCPWSKTSTADLSTVSLSSHASDCIVTP